MAKLFIQMIDELKKCEAAGATTACLMQIYVYIDTLSYLGMPVNKKKNTRDDYIGWVDKYLKAHDDQKYQYRGIDLYGARCSLLHQFSAEADYHKNNPGTIKYGYHDGELHYFDPSIDGSLALIGTASLINDFKIALQRFINDIRLRISDTNEKSVLEERINNMFAIMPFPHNEPERQVEV